MGASTIQAILVGGGGGLQLLGIGLAVVDLVDAYRRWRAYQHRGIVVEPGPARLYGTAYPPSVKVDPPPPLEDRVASLEGAMATLQGTVQEVSTDLKRTADERAQEAAATVDRRLTREGGALASLVHDVVIGGRRRWFGLGCFVVGIVAATVGSMPVWGG